MAESFPEPTSEQLAELDNLGMSFELADALLRRGRSVQQITHMTADQLFDQFCMWHGLINWGPTLRRIFNDARTFDRSNLSDPHKEGE